jgi:hypothetical protein
MHILDDESWLEKRQRSTSALNTNSKPISNDIAEPQSTANNDGLIDEPITQISAESPAAISAPDTTRSSLASSHVDLRVEDDVFSTNDAVGAYCSNERSSEGAVTVASPSQPSEEWVNRVLSTPHLLFTSTEGFKLLPGINFIHVEGIADIRYVYIYTLRTPHHNIGKTSPDFF